MTGASLDRLLQGKLADVRISISEAEGEAGVLEAALKESLVPRRAELQQALDIDDVEAAQ